MCSSLQAAMLHWHFEALQSRHLKDDETVTDLQNHLQQNWASSSRLSPGLWNIKVPLGSLH